MSNSNKLKLINGLAQELLAATEAMSSIDLSKYTAGEYSQQDLNFKVPQTFHRLFKFVAAYSGLSMKELLEQMAQCWLDYEASSELRECLRIALSEPAETLS